VSAFSQPPVIPWHRRLEARLAIGGGLLVALSLGAALVAATRVATARSLTRASENMHAAQAAFDRLVDTRAESALAQTRLITALPVFRSHITEERLASDAAEMNVMADDYRRQLRARFTIVTNRSGTWIANPGWPGGEVSPQVAVSIREAMAGRPHHGSALIGSELFLVVSEPARFAEEVLGTMTAAYAIDDGVAAELAGLAHVEVNLVSGERLAASSLRGDTRTAFAALLAQPPATSQNASASPLHDLQEGASGLEQLAGRRYVAGAFALEGGGSAAPRVRLVLLQDWEPTQQFLDELQRQLLIAGAIIFGLALVGALGFSRHLTRPLKDIAGAAGEIAAGDWDRQVPLRGSAEATALATAFNEMTGSLRRSYERFHSVTESARDAIVSSDPDGRITFWNRSAQTIFGCPKADALDQPFTRFVADEDRAMYLDTIAVLLAAAEGPARGRTIDVTAVRLDGARFPAEFSISCSSHESRLSLTSVVRDVTERKKAEEVLRQRDQELRQAQKMEAIGRLAGCVAHDFNNLLTAIRGYGELIMDTLGDRDARRDDMSEILKAADSAGGLTRQLLAFSRRERVAAHPIALDEILTGTERMLRRVIGEDMQLVCVSQKPLGYVRADRGQIEQVLMNLAVNARDAMPGGGTIRIELSNAEVEGRPAVQLTVSDTGTGMDAETASHIFEPFFTTKGEGHGTGLGLATVYNIVQQSDGTIDVDTSPGRGTTFRILLPQVAAADVPPPTHAMMTPMSGSAETVLVVEDDERVRALVCSILRKDGYSVLHADSAEQALEVAAAFNGAIELLLTDVVMPGRNGKELAEIIVRDRPGTRVMFMSGYSQDAVSLRGVRASETQFIQKPFTIESLRSKVRGVLAEV
jgi:PAS domain S-box-containing protein